MAKSSETSAGWDVIYFTFDYVEIDDVEVESLTVRMLILTASEIS